MIRMIMAVNIAWNSNKWECPSLRDFNNKNRYNFKFVRRFGFGHEFWNFDDVPNGNYTWNNVKNINGNSMPNNNPDDWYYGYFENNGKEPRQFINKHYYNPDNPDYGGIIVFISRNICDGEFYFVGLYHNAFYLHNGFGICDTTNNLLSNLPSPINDHINNNINAFNTYNICPNNPNYKLIRNIIGNKEMSVVFDNPVRVSAKDLNMRGFKRFSFNYKLDNDHKLLYDLLDKALNKNNNPNISRKIINIMNTYDYLINKFI